MDRGSIPDIEKAGQTVERIRIELDGTGELVANTDKAIAMWESELAEEDEKKQTARLCRKNKAAKLRAKGEKVKPEKSRTEYAEQDFYNGRRRILDFAHRSYSLYEKCAILLAIRDYVYVKLVGREPAEQLGPQHEFYWWLMNDLGKMKGVEYVIPIRDWFRELIKHLQNLKPAEKKEVENANVLNAALETECQKENKEAGIAPPPMDAPIWKQYAWIETSAAVLVSKYREKLKETARLRKEMEEAEAASRADYVVPEDRPKWKAEVKQLHRFLVIEEESLNIMHRWNGFLWDRVKLFLSEVAKGLKVIRLPFWEIERGRLNEAEDEWRMIEVAAAKERAIASESTESTNIQTRPESKNFLHAVQIDVNNYFKIHSKDVYAKLQKASQLFDSNDVEDHSLLLTEVRRAIKAVADFFYPAVKEPVKCSDGATRKLGNQEYLNRLWEYLAKTIGKSRSDDLLHTELDVLGVYAEKLDTIASKGVHSNALAMEAKQGLLSLYVFLFNLISRIEKKES